MPYQEIAPFPKRLTIFIGLFVVGGMAFGLALSYYKNILFDEQLQTMQARNENLRAEIDSGYRQLEYLKSTQYKDKYAKENLGLVNPGEKVLIITRRPEPVFIETHTNLTEEEKQAIFEENLRNIPIVDHWKLYLFHREKIEDLKVKG